MATGWTAVPLSWKPRKYPLDSLLAKYVRLTPSVTESIKKEFQVNISIDDRQGIITITPTSSSPPDWSIKSVEMMLEVFSNTLLKVDIPVPQEICSTVYPMVMKACNEGGLQYAFGQGSNKVAIAGDLHSVTKLRSDIEVLSSRLVKMVDPIRNIPEEYTYPKDPPQQPSFTPLPSRQNESDTIEVIGDDLNTGVLEMYFEGRLSGGNREKVVKDVKQIKKDFFHVIFESFEDAALVVDQDRHLIKKKAIQVRFPPPKQYDKKKLLLTNIPTEIKQDILILFIEGRLSLDDGDDFTIHFKSNYAILSFQQSFTDEELDEMIQKLTNKKIKQHLLTVERCEVNHSVIVAGITNKSFITEDALVLYFESSRSGGGEDVLETVEMLGKGRAKVTFNDPKVMYRVMEKKHDRLGRNVTVTEFTFLDSCELSSEDEEPDELSSEDEKISKKKNNDEGLQKAVKVQELQEVFDLRKMLQKAHQQLQEKKKELDETIRMFQKQLQEKEKEKNSIIELKEKQILEFEKTIRIQQELLQSKHDDHWAINREEVIITQEVLGQGAYGKVEVGIFRGLRVAVKSLHHLIISPYNLALFTREMNIASRVRHPNLVQFIGATKVGSPLILTELMTTSLYKELQKESQLSQRNILSISRDVALALNYLHLWKPDPIIHRDVSSPNVLLEPLMSGSFKAKVTDYGTANLQKQARTDMPGNSSYAAPEARYPDDHSPSMDVYSYCVLLMEMTLHCPPGMTVREREQQVQSISWLSMKSLVQSGLASDKKARPTMSDILKLFKN